jgi:CheY-like chemotaxis protein
VRRAFDRRPAEAAVLILSPKLLITDDDRALRETLAGALAERGFTTLQAADGQEAVEIVRQEEVHLLVVDLQMPRMNGLDAIRLVRELRDPPLPWVLMSAAINAEVRRQAEAFQVFSILEKPIRFAHIAGTIRDALRAAYHWPGN